MFENRAIDRRAFLRAGVTGAGAMALGGLLAACGGSSDDAPTSAAQIRNQLPTYTPYPLDLPTDFPGDSDGLVPYYPHYPADPKKVTSGVPGDGSAVSALTLTYSPIVPGVQSNRYWQAVNQRLGINLKMQQVASADYPTKVPTVLAGNDLPDFMQFFGVFPSFPDLLKAKFQDLTPFLGGDKVKQYPFLANIPQEFWSTQVVYNGGLYGVPIPAYKIVNYLFARNDIIQGMGLDTSFANWTEFVSLCKEVTDARSNRWTLDHVVEQSTLPQGTFGWALQCLGVPNGFAQNGGTFTSYHSDPRTKQAIGACADLVKKGYVHPAAFSGATVTWFTNIANGQAVMGMPGGLTTLPRFFNVNPDPKQVIGGSGPVPWDANTTAHGWQRTPSFSMTSLKKASESRITMLLKIANYLAAPFGSEEYQFLNYGTKGVHWNPLPDGDPQPTRLGTAEALGFGLPYIAAPPRALYYVNLSEPTRLQYEIEKKIMPASIANPTLGLYSETYGRKWAQLEKQIYNAQADIMKGNQPLSSWDDAVKTWKSQGGDQILKEYAQAFEASHK